MDRVVSRWLKTVGLFLLLCGVLAFLFLIGDLVQLIIISALFAYVLDPLVTMIESRGLPRTASIVLLFLVGLIGLGSFLVSMTPVFQTEIREIQEGFSSEETAILIGKFEQFCEEHLPFLPLEELNLADRIATTVIQYINLLFQNILNVFSLITNVVIIPFIIFFLLKDGREIRRQVISLIPNRYFEFTLNLFHKIDTQLGNYLRGMILDALIVGLLSITALLILDIRYAVIIGTFAGVANLIPYLGPVTGGLVAVVITLVESGDVARILPIAAAFGVVQLIDNIFVQPTVLARTVNLSPMIVLLAVVIGGKFFGILGMLLSVPLVSVVKVSLKESLQIYHKYRFS